jgi:alkylation response protein AidB-like acyl-CoA dehydrogenase
VWTTFAHEADFCYLVARSDRAAPKHKGLSEFVVDMRTPGVTVHPIPDLLGERHFNQVIFDGVRVPADALIGGKHRGWYQIASQLDFERGGIERIYSNVNLFRDALAAARQSGAAADGRVRDRLAQLYIAVRIGELLAQRVAWLTTCGQVPNWEAALSKCFSTETEQQVAEAVAALLGPRVLVGERDGTSLAERAAHAVLYAPAYTIQGGTSNVLRNIIATRALGLPHD